MKKSAVYLILFFCIFVYGINMSIINVQAQIIKEEQEDRLIWFGDSRTVYFAKAVYGYAPQKGVSPATVLKKHVVARRGATYTWANGNGYRKLTERLKKRPNSMVIFNFGVNDIGRGYKHNLKYLNLIKKIHKKYPKAHIYFMSINPVKASSKNPYAKTKRQAELLNRKIKAYNYYIRRHLPKGCKYINVNEKVKFQYIDGLHYQNKTYRDIAYYVTGERRLD